MSDQLPEGDRAGNEYKRGNVFDMCVWWDGPERMESIWVVARLEPSAHPGGCTNRGDDTLPDFFFEKELNSDWEFPSDYTPKIAGAQALEISTILPRREKRLLRASSFDWGGSSRIHVEAPRSDGTVLSAVWVRRAP